MLMALVVAQAPIVAVDHWMHETGKAHAATALAGAMLDEHHDHDAPKVQADDQRVNIGGAGSPPASHHHHDAPSAAVPTQTALTTKLWSSFADLSEPTAQRVDGAAPSPQDRPPKASLEHLA